MKVLLVVRWPVGGIRTYLKYMLTDGALCQNEYTIILPKIANSLQLQESLAELNIKFEWTPEGKFSFIKQVTKHVLFGRYDLVHTHGLMAAFLSLPITFLSNIKFIVSSHDVFAEHHFYGFRGALKRWATKLLFWRVSAINVLGQDAKDNLFKFFPNTEDNRVFPIRNGIVTDAFFHAKDEGLKSSLGLSEQTVLVGFLGRFMGQKGFKYLLSAVDTIVKQEMTNVRFKVLAIDANSGWEQAELSRIKELGLEDYFVFIPPKENIANLLAGLDIIAIPSVWECSPLTPMEALVVGTPVLASDCIGLNEMIKDTPAVNFKSQDTIDLREKLLSMLDEQNKPAFISFKEVARKRFDVKLAAKQLSELYKTL
ncbi:hypothetical protein BM526_12880 [Alteromonas mediterranea]|uniref:glycosyltransferase family 4 protein n=1 Tax=Alteromonas mediterranea TaxID=314275 RepID=UPI0009036547|nr:glycosyltransferase family 4 protein [Alteromonas mediterranea]APE02665.1 hypothetical protein BM526_12880 [Alteromonas mediterranea]